MATGGPTLSPENRVHLFRLQILLVDGGLLVLRNILDQTLISLGKTLSACLNQEKPTINRLKRNGVIKQYQYDVLFPPSSQLPTTSDMDITLIICLLRNLKCFGLNNKFNWNVDPQPTDVTVEADICRLQNVRNKISHLPTTTGIQQTDFTKWWNDIEQILLRRSSQALNIQQTINDFKSCPLDPVAEKRIQEEIKKWKDYEADVDQLKERMTKVEEVLEAMNRRQTTEYTEEDIYLRCKKDESEEEIYQRRKKELKDGLVEFYKDRHSQVFLSPIIEQKDTPLVSFYIRPDLNVIVENQTRNNLNVIVENQTRNNEKFPVKTLSEMFRSENNVNKEVYVIADAGLGKTAFSNHLAITWCQAHCPDKNMTKSFEQDDLDCMQRFEFLFLILLRDSNDLCSIDELIFEKIISNLCVQGKPSEDFLLKILKKEKCLVILDGLDEWTHPEKKCYKSPLTIPHRKVRKNCTVLTTTRPWKLGISNLNSIEQGKKVEITKLSKESAVKLTVRIMQRLKSYPNEDVLENDVRKFMTNIRRRNNPDITSVPLLLIYTICLWCDGVQIGNSKCDLYINIVELLLSRTVQKHGDIQHLLELSASDIPVYFTEYANCKKYYTLLITLGKLADYTLFNETRENTLVFDGSVARKYLTPDEMTFTLHTGILSESTSYTLTKKFSKVSFSHKTVQEFFAAIFTSSQSDAHKIVLEKCRNIQDILDMSKIFEFVSKMNADRMCEISRDLMSVINEDEKTRDYRTRTGDEGMYDHPLYDIQEMFLSCLEEMSESKNIQLCLQDFVIDKDNKDSEQLQRLLKQNKTNIKSLYIDASSTDSNVHDFIDLFSLTDLNHIQKLVYEGDYRKKEVEINLLLFPSLQNLTLWWDKCTNDEENLRENLTRLQNLQYLHIGGFTLSHKILETIYNFISAQKSMKELTLSRLYCKEHDRRDCKRLNLDLSKHTNITNLHLEYLPRLQLNITSPSLVDVTLVVITLDESSLLLSCDMVNIKRVVLLCIKMCAGILQKFISVLENLPLSVVVKMDDIKPETEYNLVIENILRSTQTFQVIEDDADERWRREFVFQTIKPSKE